MEHVNKDEKPHSSHRMTAAKSTIVSCASNERFGTVCKCKDCGGKFILAGQGTYLDEKLMTKCLGDLGE
jgi:hypothetical protein